MIAVNFWWLTPSTVLRNSDPPPIFPTPPPLLLYDWSLSGFRILEGAHWRMGWRTKVPQKGRGAAFIHYYLLILIFANTNVHTNMILQQQKMYITESNNEWRTPQQYITNILKLKNITNYKIEFYE
jgi:hypothetical protein